MNITEAQHSYFMALLYRIINTENQDSINRDELDKFAHETMMKAVELEIEWANDVLEDVDFVDLVDYEDYIKFVANKRMVQLGYDPIYEDLSSESDNPFPWINAYEQPNLLRADFFEEQLLYSNNSVESGVDDF